LTGHKKIIDTVYIQYYTVHITLYTDESEAGGDLLFIALSNSEPAPLYEQIEKQVIEQIMSGKLAAGSMLPSIRVLAKELEISVITVKKAYEDLEASGYIVTNQGKGSFVAEAGAEFVRENRLKSIQQSFEKGIEECRRLGMDDSTIVKTFRDILGTFE
jgi:GntR family transcriptional regulator